MICFRSPDSIPSAYLEDASGFRGEAEALFIPEDEAELADVLRQAQSRQMPVTLAGAGTGLTGGRVPLGGWIISLERFNSLQILAGTATAGAGVVLRDLHAAAAASGQLYPPDPTEPGASVGGTIACNASGSRSFRYRDTRHWVKSVRVAFLDGSIRTFRRGEAVDFPAPNLPRPRSRKHSAGFLLYPGMDWVDLFIGSEGTLGVITQAELGLLPAPQALLTGVIFFTSEEQALDAVDLWRTVDGLRMLEYLDAASLRLLAGRYPAIPAEAQAALLIEQEMSSEADEERWLGRLEKAGALADSSWFAASDTDRERFRRFRHALPEAVNDLVRRRGLMKMGTDFAVPVEHNRQMLSIYRSALDAHFPGRHVIFGHVGDAHLHVNILPDTPQEAETAQALMLEFARAAAQLGGTVGAEHGLGKRKAHYLSLLYSAEQIEAMQAVKRRFDPQGLLGRGTLFPAAD